MRGVGCAVGRQSGCKLRRYDPDGLVRNRSRGLSRCSLKWHAMGPKPSFGYGVLTWERTVWVARLSIPHRSHGREECTIWAVGVRFGTNPPYRTVVYGSACGFHPVDTSRPADKLEKSENGFNFDRFESFQRTACSADVGSLEAQSYRRRRLGRSRSPNQRENEGPRERQAIRLIRPTRCRRRRQVVEGQNGQRCNRNCVRSRT